MKETSETKAGDAKESLRKSVKERREESEEDRARQGNR